MPGIITKIDRFDGGWLRHYYHPAGYVLVVPTKGFERASGMQHTMGWQGPKIMPNFGPAPHRPISRFEAAVLLRTWRYDSGERHREKKRRLGLQYGMGPRRMQLSLNAMQRIPRRPGQVFTYAKG